VTGRDSRSDAVTRESATDARVAQEGSIKIRLSFRRLSKVQFRYAAAIQRNRVGHFLDSHIVFRYPCIEAPKADADAEAAIAALGLDPRA
jgi:hypothetical protein